MSKPKYVWVVRTWDNCVEIKSGNKPKPRANKMGFLSNAKVHPLWVWTMFFGSLPIGKPKRFKIQEVKG